jgi:opacity protein-like surface antigen
MANRLFLLALAVALTALPATSTAQMETEGSDLKSFVSVEGFYTRALGNLAPRFPSASGGYVGYGHYFPTSIVAMVKVGYSGYDLGDGVPSDQKLSAIHLLAGPRYYFCTEGIMPFIFLNVGWNIVTTKIDAPTFSSDRTSSQFGWQVGLGAAVLVVGPVAVEAQAKYNDHFLYHEGSTEGVPDRGNMTGFEYGIGITMAIQ